MAEKESHTARYDYQVSCASFPSLLKIMKYCMFSKIVQLTNQVILWRTINSLMNKNHHTCVNYFYKEIFKKPTSDLSVKDATVTIRMNEVVCYNYISTKAAKTYRIKNHLLFRQTKRGNGMKGTPKTNVPNQFISPGNHFFPYSHS